MGRGWAGVWGRLREGDVDWLSGGSGVRRTICERGAASPHEQPVVGDTRLLAYRNEASIRYSGNRVRERQH